MKSYDWLIVFWLFEHLKPNAIPAWAWGLMFSFAFIEFGVDVAKRVAEKRPWR